VPTVVGASMLRVKYGGGVLRRTWKILLKHNLKIAFMMRGGGLIGCIIIIIIMCSL